MGRKARATYGANAATSIGRVQKHPQGFAFILSLDPSKPDTYVDKFDAQNLINRDLVRFSTIKDGKRTRANILKIIERGVTHVYGEYLSSPKPHVRTPPGEIFLCEHGGRANHGDWVIAVISQFPKREAPARVRIERILGSPRPADDSMIATVVYGIPSEFSLDAKLEARKTLEDDLDRVDLTNLCFVTIDGADAKDFDDAIFVRTQSGPVAWTLYVAIADVSHYVRPGTKLNQEAKARSTSVYFPGECIPMLPESLSNDLCSLTPGTPKLVMVAELHFNRDGVRTGQKFYAATILSKGRLTYDDVHSFFNQATHSIATPLKEPLTHARALFRKLHARRLARHALDFDFPELKVETNDAGVPVKVFNAPRWESHQLIEEFMVEANSSVAEFLENHHTLFRVHEPPDPNKLTDLNELLKTLGISKRVTHFDQDNIAELLKIKNPVLHKAILRMQRQARYGFEPLGHYGLALKDYLHFTSPIRRFPDLIVHRSLKAALSDSKYSEDEDSPYDLGVETSEKERRAMEAERFVTRRKMCWFVKDKLGSEFEGTITDLNANGIGVTLSNGIEGFVPMANAFDESKIRIKVGGTYLKLGSPVLTQLIRVDVEIGRIELDLI